MDNIKFELGKPVLHRTTSKKLWMLKEGREQILCRTEDLREIWFYPDELLDITETGRVVESRRFL